MNGATPAEAKQLVAYSRNYYETIIAQANGKQRIAALSALDGKRSPADKAMAEKYKMNRGIVANLKAGGNKHVESAILPSLNHLFQTAKTGAEDEYTSIDETFAPLAMQRVAAFVAKQK